MNDAIGGMNDLLNNLPSNEQNFQLAKTSERKDIETQRFTEDGIVFAYLDAKRMGLDYDQRKDEYAALDGLKMEDVKQFHDQELASKAYTYCVVASDKKVKVDDLKKVGDVKVLALEEIFGY